MAQNTIVLSTISKFDFKNELTFGVSPLAAMHIIGKYFSKYTCKTIFPLICIAANGDTQNISSFKSNLKMVDRTIVF